MDETSLNGLDFKDVYLIPQYSEITSRAAVDISVKVGQHTVEVPVISANMDTVTGPHMAIAMAQAGAIGAIHRFYSIRDEVDAWRRVKHSNLQAFVSVGVNRDSQERTQELYRHGARYFVIDIAHGHSKMMKDMINWMKTSYSDIFLMAGNVATYEGTKFLIECGADAVKVGIGPGAVCLTKNVTGVTVPQLGAIQDCAFACSQFNQLFRRNVLLVADGGIREYGDIAKAIGAGADLVMCGGLFAGADETPGETLINGQKVYRGMASRDAMRAIRVENAMPTPEGTSTLVDSKGPVKAIVEDIAGGLRSAFSYSNARTLNQFKSLAKFGVRRR